MVRAGLLFVLVGVVGRLVAAIAPLQPAAAGTVTLVSWAVVAFGVLLVLIDQLHLSVGYGGYGMAIGVGLLIWQAETGWLDRPELQKWHFWIGLGLAVLIGGSALATVESAVISRNWVWVALVLGYAVASLVADIVFDFGEGWDELMNVSTAVFIAWFALAVVIQATNPISILEEMRRSEYPIVPEPGWANPVVMGHLNDLARGVTAGFGGTAVIITVIASFEPPTFVNVLLVLLAVLGGYLAVQLIEYLLLVRAVGAERLVRGGLDMSAPGLRAEFRGRIAPAVTGYLAVAVVLEVIIFRPPVWLTILLLVMAVAVGVLAARLAFSAFHRMRRRVEELLAAPGRSAPYISELLRDLGQRDPVYRLLPGADFLGY